jgi:choline dehydrogenase-like flavoprotein
MSIQSNYDAIVIGSGIGGLAVASLMAKLCSWRVLVTRGRGLETEFLEEKFNHA